MNRTHSKCSKPHSDDNSSLYTINRDLQDFNNDGVLDLQVKAGGKSANRFGQSDYKYDFNSLQVLADTTFTYQSLDLEQDGDMDLFMVKDDHAVVFLNDGTGGFTENSNSIIASRLFYHLLNDMDSEGDIDTLYYRNGVLYFAKNQHF